MHYSPIPLTTALTIIRDADLSELADIKDSITNSLLADISSLKRRPETGDAGLDEVRSWVDDLRIKNITTDRRKMLDKIIYRQQQGNKPILGGVTEQMIEQANLYPIENLITTKIFGGSSKWAGCCHCPLPTHQGERTPSFYFDKNNRWKCFGCAERGSVVDLYMKLNGVKFIQAVKQLV
jgi:CHC2 zinc finger